MLSGHRADGFGPRRGIVREPVDLSAVVPPEDGPILVRVVEEDLAVSADQEVSSIGAE